jgi:GMP synthase-like glutamine amidotransferase
VTEREAPVRALVLQHIACEPPGVYAEVMQERGWRTMTCEVDEVGEVPALRTFDAIVAMGGPMSVNDEVELPWLTAEKGLIAAAVADGVPYFGTCLGVQLLASSLGAKVYAGARPEVGILPVELTDEGRVDPVLGDLDGELLTLQWHGDTFDLPVGAVRLASSSAYQNQAFRYGSSAYGVQFHVEVSAEMAEEWANVPEYAASLERTVGAGALGEMIEALRDERGERMLEQARGLFRRWCDLAEDETRG